MTNARFYQAKSAKAAVIMVGGIGGGFDSPANDLYPNLASRLAGEDIITLRVQFRYPTDLVESVHDVLVGARFLQNEGVKCLGLVGHSFGGAVVIQAGIALETVKTVVTLATQAFGADEVAELSPHASILLIHGANDKTLSQKNSRIVYQLAKEPKRLEILEGNGHGLAESSQLVSELVHDWLVEQLGCK